VGRVLRELTLARLPADVEVAEAMRRAEELADQKSGDTTVFVAAMEAVVQAEKDKRFGEALQVMNCRPRDTSQTYP
jgi:hypothetical protein